MGVVLLLPKPVMNAVRHMKTFTLIFLESPTIRWSQKEKKEETEVEEWLLLSVALPLMASAEVMGLGSSLRS